MLSELLALYRMPTKVKLPWKSIRPQCQISMPGLSGAFTQFSFMPAGTPVQGTVCTLLAKFGGLSQCSTQTTVPVRL